MKSLKVLAALTATVICIGCKPAHRSAALDDKAKELPFRYEESVLLDKAAVNCWHWRPLPDSLCLQGYDGVRYIARLNGLPKYNGGPEWCRYMARCELAGEEENNVAAFIRPGGGIEDCDVVWDVFWKRQQDSAHGDFEYKERFMLITEEPDGLSSVQNRTAVHDFSRHLPEGSSLTPNGDSKFRTLAVEYGKKQMLFSLTFAKKADEKTVAIPRVPAAELKWSWAIGQIGTEGNVLPPVRGQSDSN